MSLWLALLGMSAVTFALRASFLLLPPGVETPALVRRALRYVPATVLTAIWAPAVVFPQGSLQVSIQNEQLLAAAVAIAVAWRWRQTFATIASGLLALHLFAWLI
jgi:branched-subunit amino acid transport protein